MWFRRLFKRRAKPVEEDPRERPVKEGPKEANIDQGVYYLYLIIGLQVLFVFVLIAVITAFGKFLATPTWVFVFTLFAGIAGIIYVYRKAKQKLARFRDSLQNVNLSNRNYEISFMGGVVTMRVEQNTRPLLEAPPGSVETVVDAETVDITNPSKASSADTSSAT